MKPFIAAYLSLVLLSIQGCDKKNETPAQSSLPFHMHSMAYRETDVSSEISENDSLLFPDFTVHTIDVLNDGSVWFSGVHHTDADLNTCLVHYRDHKAYLYTFPEYNQDNLLIRHISHDSKGHVFFSGFRGLAEFDGSVFSIYQTEDTIFNDSHIINVCVDKQNVIWFSLSDMETGGVVKTDLNSWQYFSPDNTPMPNRMIRNIAADENNQVWFTNNDHVGDGAIIKYCQDKWTVYPLNLFYITDMTITDGDQIYVFMDYGLSSSSLRQVPYIMKYENESWKSIVTCNYPDESDCMFAIPTVSASDKGGNIWICSIGPESSYPFHLYCYNGSDWLKIKSLDIPVFDIIEYPDGLLWLGTSGGIYKLKTK